jgi:tetratricopeptide (TPR) repeat protein
MKPRVLRHAWLAIVFLLAGVASAQSPPQATPRPWERDVSAEDQRLAETLFAQALELHDQLLRDLAMTRYEEALSHWDHPDIRLNLALLMKDMGQYLRAYEHLEAALAWGPEALDEHDRDRLLAERQKLLKHHLAVVEGRCDRPGAEVALDGKPWFRGPGEARQVVLPGEHVFTARKPGYFPVAKNIMVSAGARGVVTLSMSVDGIIETRRWKPWTPWAVIASGVVVGMVGAGLDWDAARQLDRARNELDESCGSDLCDPATPGAYDRALWEHRIGTGAMVAGGTLAATGLALVFLNQPRAYRTEDRDRGTFELVPMASPDTAGVSARFRF